MLRVKIALETGTLNHLSIEVETITEVLAQRDLAKQPGIEMNIQDWKATEIVTQECCPPECCPSPA
jgi:hypothetical protein